MNPQLDARQRGFGVVAAIVILVILSGLAGFIVSLSTTQSLTLAADVQGARALQATRAGVDYGVAQWLSTHPSVDANCTSLPALSLPAAEYPGITVTVTGTVSPPPSGGRKFCQFTVTATTGGSAGSLGFVERRLTAIIEGNS